MIYSEFIDKVLEHKDKWDNKYECPYADFYSRIIEPVYTYHPGQFNKDEIAVLYCIGGPALMRDLYQASLDSMELEKEIQRYKREVSEMEKDLEEIYKSYNRCK